MTEIVIENTTETVIELEGGPILTTTISDESMVVVDVPADPIIVDLNSGPVGEIGSQVLTGTDPPSALVGRLNDLYLVTSPNGSPSLGDLYVKEAGGWVLDGNIRGATGGINSVNGYTGPAVTLGKADLTLGNVDNTSDAAKPISTATQTALNGKVNNTGAETIAGVKTFSSAPVVPDSSFAIAKTTNLQTTLDGKVSLTGAQTISDVKTFSKTPLHTPETGPILHTQITTVSERMWHDRFRFAAHTFQTSADGTTWNAGSGGSNALDGRGDTSTAITHTERYVRWTWDNTNDMAFANIQRLIVRWGYVATNPDVIVTVETSTNGTVWTSRGTTTMTGASTTQNHFNFTDNGGDTYFRVTMQAVGGLGSGNVALVHNLEIQTYRTGSQGKGFEIEVPYWWNGSREIGLYNTLRPMSHNVYDVGTTGLRFKDAYFAGVVNAGTFSGSGASLTALPAANLAGTIADARLSSNVSLLNGVQTITAVKTFSVSPIVPTPTTDMQAATKKYIDDAILVLTNGSPALLNTLDELAAALGDDANFATTMTNNLALKAPLASPTFTGTVSGITKAMVGLGNVVDAAQVELTGAQTIAGVKTFSSAPVVPDASFTIAKTTGLQAALDLKAPLASPTFTGVITGDGSGLTALNGTNISSGTVADARLPSFAISKTTGLQAALDAKQPLLATNGLVSGDWNAYVTSGVWRTDNVTTNGPAGAYIYGTLVVLNSSTQVVQTYYPHQPYAGIAAYVRNKYNASDWSTWRPLADATSIVFRVIHGATAGTTRPSSMANVEWVGSVAPTNATANDTWVNTSV